MSNIDKCAQKELYAKVEQQANKLRGNPIAYQVVTGMCPVNVIEMHAKKIQELLDQLEAEQRISSTWRKTAESNNEKLEAAERRIAELEAREVQLPPKAPDNLASCLDGYEKWLIATTFRDTWNACLAEVVHVNVAAGKGE
jgi:polyhydroxyalkanoate synthesis regulator phasin